VFDVLCRHMDCDAEGWISTDSKEIIKLVKDHNGIKIEAITPIMNTLKEFGYVELIWNEGFRSVAERFWCKTDYRVRVSDTAWDSKEPVRAPLHDPARRKALYYAKKAKANL